MLIRILAVLVLLILIAPISAYADPEILSQVVTYGWNPTGASSPIGVVPLVLPETFTVGTSPTAMISATFTFSGEVFGMGAYDTPEHTAFTNSITNGTLDNLTLQATGPNGDSQAVVIPESFFATPGISETQGGITAFAGEQAFGNGSPDWKGFQIDYYHLWLVSANQGFGSGALALYVYGSAVPEPASVAMLTMGGLGVLVLSAKGVRT